MNISFRLALLCSFLLAFTTQAQIPGFIEKWRVNTGTTNDTIIRAIGRDGAVLASGWDNSNSWLIWISPSGQVIAKILDSEFVPEGVTDIGMEKSFVPVLVLSSNLVIQSQYVTNYQLRALSPMLIVQITRSGGALQKTKTQFLAFAIGYDSMREHELSDFSCPQRLMFVQQADVLICYRPAVDIDSPLTALKLSSVSNKNAELLVTSSQGGPLQLQGSTNLTNWQTITNLQAVPGLSTFELPLGNQERVFYRGVTQ
jgi:hypothetical protein